jgi:acyl-CoA thioester hydrolase
LTPAQLGSDTVLTVRSAPEPSLNPDDYTFAHQIRVRFSETDAMGIVHHSRYLPYLEETRVEYLRSIGQSYADSRETLGDSAVLEATVKYRQPLKFDDVMTVHLVLAATTGATFTINYLITVGEQAASTASTQHAYINAQGRPQRLPAWIKELAAQ